MNDNNYKKILFLGCSLHYSNATGITLSNLFKGWPKENIFIASPYKDALLSAIEGYEIIYSLGKHEFKHRFPLNIFKKKYYSGPLNFSKSDYNEQKTIYNQCKKDRILFFKNFKSIQLHIENLVEVIFHFIGYYHYGYRCVLSIGLNNWIEKNNPDIIYTLLSSRASILLALEVYERFKKPVVIHIMDDWPSTIVCNGFFSSYWKRKIDKEFRILLSVSCTRFAISELMSLEYAQRYSYQWDYYHNPVDFAFWNPHFVLTKNENEYFTVVYTGRIGLGISHSLIQIARAIQLIKNVYKKNIKFILQTKDLDSLICKKLTRFSCVQIQPYIEYKNLPFFLESCNLLLLPYDFNGRNFRFIRLSMPTKVSEYLATLKPVLYFGPKGTALHYHALKYKWGYVVDVNNYVILAEKIFLILKSKQSNNQYLKNAYNTVINQFEINKVSSEFQKKLTDSSFYIL